MITDGHIAWPEGRHATDAYQGGQVEPLAAPGTYPVPTGRGLWRMLVLDRAFAYNLSWGELALGELNEAFSRSLERKWNDTATFSFSIPGNASAATEVRELMTDILALRWDDQVGYDRPMFRGIVSQSQDTISEQAHTVNFTCHDYSAMLFVRFLDVAYNATGDQDAIVDSLLWRAQASYGGPLPGGYYLPIVKDRVYPDGTQGRDISGQDRVRQYPAGSIIGELIKNLGAVDGGFDWDVQPFGGGGQDYLRLFYPYQGVTKSTPALIYGSTVNNVSRTVNSADYGNFIRVIGNNGSSDPNAAQLYSNRYNADINNVSVVPVGMWQRVINASDVSLQATLDEQAAGQLALSGTLVPTYSLGLRPGAYSYGSPNMGDVVPLIIRTGRLDVNTTVRVLGITYDIGDDGQEDVKLTVGRPAVTLPHLLYQSRGDIDALARR